MEIPKIYDVNTDTFRPVTQADIDLWEKWAMTVGQINHKIDEARPVPTEFNFRLAVFPNRMRPGRAFVAQDLPIEPYDERDGNGQYMYPNVPGRGIRIGYDLDEALAIELVRRWNKGA